jgi:hypothetical protein
MLKLSKKIFYVTKMFAFSLKIFERDDDGEQSVCYLIMVDENIRVQNQHI